MHSILNERKLIHPVNTDSGLESYMLQHDPAREL